MDAEPQSRLFRIVARTGLGMIGGVIGAILGMMLLFVVALLRVTKPVVYYPLSLGVVSGVGVAIVFAVTHRWHDAFGAALTALVAAVILGIYEVVAEWADPRFFEPSRSPPWWWFV